MEKTDLKKASKALYRPSSKDVTLVDVPEVQFLMVDGEGDPNESRAYAHAVEAFFSVSYAVKFKVKKGPQAMDYAVMPLEGLWWADDMTNFQTGDKSQWKWTMMMAQPGFLAPETVRAAIDEVSKKKKNPFSVRKLRLENFTEGMCAQLLHIGPFSEEGPAIEKVHAFIRASGFELAGKHHEIYLSDVRRADPAKCKTIIRQPMAN